MKLSEYLSFFEGHERRRIYTDGSKDGEAVGVAAITSGRILVCQLSDHVSIFSAQAHVFHLVLDVASGIRGTKFLILSDFLSCLQSISNRTCQNPLILDIINRINNLMIELWVRYVVFMVT